MDAMEIKKRMEAARSRGGGEEVIAMVREMQAMQFESDLKWTRVGYLVAAVIFGGVGAALVALGVSMASTQPNGPTIPILVSGACALVTSSLVAFFWWTIKPPPGELRTTGIPAEVTVEDYRSAFGSLTVGSQDSHAGSGRQISRVAIDLSVRPSEGAPYRVTVKQHISGAHLVALQIGATFDAFVDRGRQDLILIVFER